MFYIHQTTCISPQETFLQGIPVALKEPVDNLLKAIQPSYEGIPAGILRRMSKSVKMGVGAALPLGGQFPPNGILIGTGDGGMEDSVRFLQQILEHNEGILAPGHFVQSTPNAIASQMALLSLNKGYNITHVHRGLAFENALTDASMLLKEYPANNYLVGGIDEISSYNYRLQWQDGWYKKETASGKSLYESNSPGSIAGEGAALFLVNNSPVNALSKVKAITTLHSRDEDTVRAQLLLFLERHLPAGKNIDLLLTGENGDNRTLKWSALCEAAMDPPVTIARYKHMSGEYPTASAFALWLACTLQGDVELPAHMRKEQPANVNPMKKDYSHILLCNNYQYSQHSFILIEKLP
jgi:hypothetical protein